MTAFRFDRCDEDYKVIADVLATMTAFIGDDKSCMTYDLENALADVKTYSESNDVHGNSWKTLYNTLCRLSYLVNTGSIR